MERPKVTAGITAQSQRLWVRFAEQPDDATKATLRAAGLTWYAPRGDTFRQGGRWQTASGQPVTREALGAVYMLTGIAPKEPREARIHQSLVTLVDLGEWLEAQPPPLLRWARATAMREIREQWSRVIGDVAVNGVDRAFVEGHVLEWAERLASLAPPMTGLTELREEHRRRWAGASKRYRRVSVALATVDRMLVEASLSTRDGDALAMFAGCWPIDDGGGDAE